jgi:hypothetical protein
MGSAASFLYPNAPVVFREICGRAEGGAGSERERDREREEREREREREGSSENKNFPSNAWSNGEEMCMHTSFQPNLIDSGGDCRVATRIQIHL